MAAMQAPVVADPPWAPECMDAYELAQWTATNRKLAASGDRAARPCADCLPAFAAEMRSEGRCNGTPMGHVKDKDAPIPMIQPAARDERPAMPVRTAPPQRVAVVPVVEAELQAAAVEGLKFLRRAFLDQVPMDEPKNRALASAATSVVGSWTRAQAAKAQLEQATLVRAAILARDLGGKQSDYLDDAPKLEAGDAPAR